MPTSSVVPFSSPDRIAGWTRRLLAAGLVMSVVGAFSSLFQLELLSHAAQGISPADAAANDSRQQWIGILQTTLLITTGVVFLVWIHRSYRNLPALGARELRFTPGWAMGGFFVPFLNVVRPPQVVREIWHASDPSGLERDLSADGPMLRKDAGMPPLVLAWWTLVLVDSFVGNVATRMAFAPDPSLADVRVMTIVLVLSDVTGVISAIPAFRLVGQIATWQDERAALVQQRGMAAAMDPEAMAPLAN